MHMETTVPDNAEVAILARVLSNGQDPLPPEWARQLLTLGFSTSDEARMNDLAKRNAQGSLSQAEKEELLGYAKAGCVLGILQSKARRALKVRFKAGKPKTTVP